MFVTAVCFPFLLKLKWPKNKNIYDDDDVDDDDDDDDDDDENGDDDDD